MKWCSEAPATVVAAHGGVGLVGWLVGVVRLAMMSSMWRGVPLQQGMVNQGQLVCSGLLRIYCLVSRFTLCNNFPILHNLKPLKDSKPITQTNKPDTMADALGGMHTPLLSTTLMQLIPLSRRRRRCDRHSRKSCWWFVSLSPFPHHIKYPNKQLTLPSN